MEAKLTLEQAKSKKQSKKVRKYANATQDMQAQMFQWHSLMKTILPNLPPPKSVLDSLSDSEHGSDDDDDDDDCSGGVQKWHMGWNGLFCAQLLCCLLYTSPSPRD